MLYLETVLLSVISKAVKNPFLYEYNIPTYDTWNFMNYFMAFSVSKNGKKRVFSIVTQFL